MAQDREHEETAEDPAAESRGGGRRLRTSLIIGATVLAGAGAALVLRSRRGGGVRTSRPDEEPADGEDLAAVLRRAAVDVAIAATNEAAERLSGKQSSEPQGREHSAQQS